MGMTDLQDYWVAAHLTNIQSWFSSSTEKLWIDIERTTSSTPSLHSLLSQYLENLKLLNSSKMNFTSCPLSDSNIYKYPIF